MEQRDLYVDNRIMHRIKYNRDSYSECIYCGQKADSREHVPSRVFIQKPYPENLSIVPSCSKCNNGYSLDEIFLYLCIEKLKKCYYPDYEFCDETISRLKKYKNIADEVDSLIKNLENQGLLSINPYTLTDARINNVFEKLALGHAVYELSVGYKSDSWSGKCNSIYYKFLPNLSADEIEEIDSCFILDNELLPEIGSRIYDKIYIIKATLEEGREFSLCLLDWVDIQDKAYRYTCYVFGSTIIVKIVISEFLYAVITFEENFT